ncbi:Cation transporter [Pleurostoma richardsiae]|uniref:Potassium transport protein n=1 Tax=Pleurostoma richardsiae TaxID=41990 RepID=A0AA38RYM5_9PEZI|nr:Cation transporter [Pleurostoma richardsiae]
MTEAGLNTVNLSEMTTWQQILLWLLILFGSTIWVSIWTVVFRLHVFEQRFDDIVKQERERERERRLRRPTSAAGLPILSKFASFRKAVTTPPSEPTLAGTGTRLQPSRERETGADILEPSGSSPGAFRRPASSPAVDERDVGNVEGTSRGCLPLINMIHGPTTADGVAQIPDGHITFIDTSQPTGAGSEGATGTASGCSRTESRAFYRGVTEKQVAEKARAANGWHVHSFLTNKTVGRNGQFHGLTTEEREQLGGYEYRALKVLAVIVSLYFFAWQFLGCVSLGAWMATYQPDTARQNGINSWWLGIFNGASAFNNSGMSLLDANMIPFENAHYVLITMGLMILAGNTAYPIFLRLILWTMLKVLKFTTTEEAFSDFKGTLEFILKYPRRVYTNLFPPRPTWWLLFMLICLNCTDWVAFELLNLGNPIIEAIPTGSRILDGLFQALAVRSGGFYVVPIPSVYIGLQVLYVIMMYISVYPVVITMRHSNVYEERSLGIYTEDASAAYDLEDATRPAHHDSGRTVSTDRAPLGRRFSRSSTAVELSRALRRTFTPWQGVGVPPRRAGDSGSGETRISFISQQIHGQLAHDIWWLVLAVLVITTIETSHFMADPVTYSVFNVIFEVVSAYGCVGISVGLPTASYSFSGGWHWPSKLVLCLVMLRGRHRGLPVALDRAVRLPGEELHRDEEEDHIIRRSMTMTSHRMSVDI